MISAEVEEITLPWKAVCTRIIMSQLEIWCAEVSPFEHRTRGCRGFGVLECNAQE
jgi:hypothetical protein